MPETLSIIMLGIYILAAVVLGIYGINCYVMMALFTRRNRGRRAEERELLRAFEARTTDDDLPVVTTQLPIYNERNVVERLLRAVCAFDYPEGKHEIQVLDDSTDETVEIVARLCEELRAEGHDIKHLYRRDRSGYKAGALAEGTRSARGELLAVFDADFVPPPDFLRRTVPFLVMDPGCGFVQTRWGHRNRRFSTLTMAQSIGIDGHFVVEQSARAWNWLFLNFNGTAGVWRRKAMDEAGGWKADTLTEDLDLSYRTQLAGWHARFLFDVVTPAEIPTNINAFKSQQFRWAKGSIQTAIKLLPQVFRRSDIGPFKKIEALLHLTHYLIHPFILLITLLVLPLILFGQWMFSAVIMIPLLTMMVVALFAPSTLYLFSQRAAYRNWTSTLLFLPALMAIGVGLAVNNTRAVIEALIGRKSEFVRTPKLGQQAEQRSAPVGQTKQYRNPMSLIFLLEIAVGLWAFAAFGAFLLYHRFLIGPLLLLHAVGFTYVGLTSYWHDRKERLQGT